MHFLESLLKANVWKLFITADVKNLGLWIMSVSECRVL